MSEALSEHLDRLLKPILGHTPSRWPATVRRAARRIAKREGVEVTELLARLTVRPDAELIDELVGVATVPHTKFFRHREHFDYLQRRVLPEFKRRRRHLSVWSAGCASGQEAYSLAMTAHDFGVSCRILATDVSRERIEEARGGAYSARAARHIPGVHGAWTAPESLRRMIRFEVSSLVGPDPAHGHGPFDLVFCRNVLIYFNPEEGLTVVGKLLERLKPAGALVVAPTEAVVRAPWRRPEPDAPVGWFVPDDDKRRITGRPAPALVPRRPPPSPGSAPAEMDAARPEAAPRLEDAARQLSDGDVEGAERLLATLLERDPEHAEAWFLLGEALFSRGELIQARAAFLRAARATRHDNIDPQTLSDAASRRAEACVDRRDE